MALKDLTPQLRTRLSRVERAVGWFVLLAVLLLAFGFGYYAYNTAQRKGWFQRKITYQTCVSSAAGLKVGDPVKLLGFEAGEITAIIPNDPDAWYNITLRFQVKVNRYNYQGYIWSDSRVKINPGDLLGNRYLEITKGLGGVPTIHESTNHQILGVLRQSHLQELQKRRFESRRKAEVESARGENREARSDADLVAEVVAELNSEAKANPVVFYTNNFDHHIYFLEPQESPAVSDRLDRMVSQIENAVPGILDLTNRINAALTHATRAASNLNDIATSARPTAENLGQISADLRRAGGLGEWALGTNGLGNVNALVARLNGVSENADTNLVALIESVSRSLDNLADITSNLNVQVQSNTNLLGGISGAVVHADQLVQGLKRHWLLRSAFRDGNTNAAAPRKALPELPPRARGAFH
jgi:ABC-type transporter Mla subunit MlaD